MDKRAAIGGLVNTIQQIGEIELVDARYGHYFVNSTKTNLFVKHSSLKKNRFDFGIAKTFVQKAKDVEGEGRVFVDFIC